MNDTQAVVNSDLVAFLRRSGLTSSDDQLRVEPLNGGVSSDIWRVDLGDRSICVKRALAQLKVAAVWTAPLSRNAYEWAWLEFANSHCPANVPRPLAHDAEAGFFAMSYLEPGEHPVWKQKLLDGHVSPNDAHAVGQVLGRVHAASAGDPAVAAAFPTIENFYALRLEPYIVASAARHADLAPALYELMAITAGTQKVLVHGDVSPKNILIGPNGPVFLDAECAWYGDPAFDVAFCLNHLLLKGVARPHLRGALNESFSELVRAYFAEVNWESRAQLEKRIAALLPALFLARVDGKSPVEYITGDVQKAFVRAVAAPLLLDPASSVDDVRISWEAALKRMSS